MQADQPLGDLPQSFRHEQQQLLAAGITTWIELSNLNDNQLSRIARSGLVTARNLKRLRGMAALVCELNLAAADAALLMHSGLATVSALAAASPQDVVQQTGRLERQLHSGLRPVIDLATAHRWIKLARNRQLGN
ncbi:MAG: Uncharacterised protein [Prochlorococcus marinus str. MIT 9215]|jgi:hypothetical protein|nr:MAG: Uncharacterised protein [Prochlorococcus marinus str. MIT 9215]